MFAVQEAQEGTVWLGAVAVGDCPIQVWLGRARCVILHLQKLMMLNTTKRRPHHLP